MQKLHRVRPKEDIEAADCAFPENHCDDKFPKIDSKHSAHVANQVGWHQREKTPGEDNDHRVAPKDFLELLHTCLVLSLEYIIEMQGFGKIVDTHG